MSFEPLDVPLPAPDADLPPWAQELRKHPSPLRLWWMTAMDLTHERLSAKDRTQPFVTEVPILNATTHVLWFEGLHLAWKFVEPLEATYPKGTVSSSYTFVVKVHPFSGWPTHLEQVSELPINCRTTKPTPGDNYSLLSEIETPFYKMNFDEADFQYQCFFLGKGLRIF